MKHYRKAALLAVLAGGFLSASIPAAQAETIHISGETVTKDIFVENPAGHDTAGHEVTVENSLVKASVYGGVSRVGETYEGGKATDNTVRITGSQVGG